MNVELNLQRVRENTVAARRVLVALTADFPLEREEGSVCSQRALDFVIITAKEARDPVVVAKLDAIAGRVLRQALVLA